MDLQKTADQLLAPSSSVMSEASSPEKRGSNDDRPQFDDPADLINAVISTLQTPEEKTYVSQNYSNVKNTATEVQAYAKIAGCDWTFYVKSLAVSIGRNTEGASTNQSTIDIDLGPAKVVSRNHANITYNLELRCWELKVLGRNGARIDGTKIPVGESHATPLHSGAIIDVGGTQMMFILPDSPPTISEKMLSICLAKYKANLAKVAKPNQSGYPQQHTIPVVNHRAPSFQMFDKAHLTQSPSALSATSLQSNLDQDLSKEEAKDMKPPYSYATMITQAILSNPDGVMSLAEIYNWIASHYAYYKYSKTGWQNSIRHNLSLNKAFEKVPRRPNEPGKGMKWQISESYKEEFMNKVQSGSLLKSRRGSSVLRQLQLHLATHQQLPESNRYHLKDNTFRHQKSMSMDTDLARKQMLPKLGQPMQYSMSGNNYMPQQANYTNNNAVPYQPDQSQQMFYGATNQSFPSQQNFGVKSELSSPIRQLGEFGNTPRAGNNNVFNLPPPLPSTTGAVSSAPQAHHSRLNSYNHGIQDQSYPNSSSESNQNSNHMSASLTQNTSDLGLSFTSPKKITPLEAFTPERGTKPNSHRLGVPNGTNTNQSSPAFWNFVQFSTPNGPSPMRKNSDETSQASPTLGRRKGPNEDKDDSPLKDGNDEPKTKEISI